MSGENLAIVTGVVLGATRRLRTAPRLAATLTLVVIVAFVVVARPSPSVLRAAVMGGVGAFGLVGGHRRQALAGLAAAVLFLVLADPSLAGQAGFALSVLASLGCWCWLRERPPFSVGDFRAGWPSRSPCRWPPRSPAPR